ncbi:MAG: class I SAM-dependent methyltransferase [Leptolyngbyaceae cyanobacterium]
MNKTEFTEFFDRWAPSYDTILPSVLYQAVHKRLMDYVHLPSPCQVLEVGCGTGKLLARLAQHWSTLSGVGIDLSTGMIAQAEQNFADCDRLQVICGDVTRLPFATRTFDAVFCSISFLHYPQPAAAFQAIVQILKPSGKLYLADFVPPRWQDIEIWRPGISPGGIALYSANAREQLGKEAGLVCDRHHYLLGPVMMTQFSAPGSLTMTV